MGSEAVVEAEKATPEAEKVDREKEEEEEQVTPEAEKRGTKRESPNDEEEEGSKRKRPARERKSVERYSALSPRKAPASKAISIPQGSGTKLKDIPNVVFKLSKRKVDDNLQALHTVLFGRRSNAHFLKRNILQFSGFVWTENKEKHKTKVMEKLDKYTKDKLIDFCELLDIHFPRTTTKKEDVSAKLLEFLESPHVTRDLLLADKDKKVKRRRSRTKVSSEAAEEASSDKETKKHKKSTGTEVKKGRKQSPKAEEEDEHEDSADSDDTKDASSGEEDNNVLEEESDHDKLEEEAEENESVEPLDSKKGSDKTQQADAAETEGKGRTKSIKKTSTGKSEKSRSKPVLKKAAQRVDDEPDVAVDSKHSSTKEQASKKSKTTTNEKVAPLRKEDKKKSRKSASLDASDSGPSKSSKPKQKDKKKNQNKEPALLEDKKGKKKKEMKPAAKVSTKEQGKGKKKAGPSTEELHSVVSNILKEVDFNTATLADILKQLGAHFNMDLMDRKAEVKSIIEVVINSMTDDDEGNEDEDNLGDNEEGNTKEDEDNLGDNEEGNTKEDESDGDSK